MAIDNAEVIDATAYEGKKLILQLYDHLEFDDEIIKEHMFMLQDKLNTYIWFIDSKQYEETYPNASLSVYEIQIKFKYQPSDFCIEYLNHVNNKLGSMNITVMFEVTDGETPQWYAVRRQGHAPACPLHETADPSMNALV